MNETQLTEKGALPNLGTSLREQTIGQLITFATFATSARLIQENELTVMKAVFTAVLTEIETENLLPALDLTIKARIASGNTYPITPIEIASRWAKRGTEISLPTCSQCTNGFVVIRKPNERPEVVPCEVCNA